MKHDPNMLQYVYNSYIKVFIMYIYVDLQVQDMRNSDEQIFAV